MEFDEDTSRKVEALYLTPDVVEQRCLVLKALQLREGERVLDVGSGPGLLAYDMAASVGPVGRVCGIDISEDMLAMSRRRCANQPWTEFQRADATKLPHPDDAFDAAVSTQVYEYVADISTALAELHRVTRPGGRVVVVDTDYDSLVVYTSDQARMERVLSAWGDHFVHGGLPRTLTGQLRDAGFTIRQRDVVPMFNPEYHDNTYARRMLAIVASFVVGRRGVSQEEANAWLAEFSELGEQGKFFFSLNRYLFVADKIAVR
ncbi:methyltransferase domain-containing protein [Mesorhizobium sp. M1E.F.Ca.ET.063.01.1.1]|nr:methyltransferase domain-containing protein [Mesorhizobium sp. M1E.F.Ca.ET.063.01.1.1]